MKERDIYTCYPFGPKGSGTSVPDPVRIAIEELEFTSDGEIDPDSITALEEAAAIRSPELRAASIGVVLLHDSSLEAESVAGLQMKATALHKLLREVLSEESIVSIAHENLAQHHSTICSERPERAARRIFSDDPPDAKESHADRRKQQ